MKEVETEVEKKAEEIGWTDVKEVETEGEKKAEENPELDLEEELCELQVNLITQEMVTLFRIIQKILPSEMFSI